METFYRFELRKEGGGLCLELGSGGLWALSCPLTKLSVTGVEVPEVIKNLCRRASYISQEKIW